MDWTEESLRAALAELPRRRVTAEEALELEGGGSAWLRLDLDVSRDGLSFDFTRTDPQVAESVNTTRAVTVSAVFYVLRLLCGDEVPTNDGLLRPARIATHPGTLLDACYPAAVAAGNVETSQRAVDLLLSAFSQLLPDRIPAQSAGTMTNLTLGSASGAPSAFSYYETVAGGAGAGPAGDGEHAVQTHMTNTRNSPVEALENELPLRVLSLTVRRGSGGRGGARGGDGLTKRLRILAPARVAWIAERQRSGPRGLFGGGDGAPGRFATRLPGEQRDQPRPGKAGIDLPAGSELLIETPGGGGFCTPREG